MHYLVFKINASSLKNCFLFIIFFKPYLMLDFYLIKLSEVFGIAKLIVQFIYQK